MGGLAIELLAFGISFIASNREIERLRSNNLTQAKLLADLQNAQQSRILRIVGPKFKDSLRGNPTGEAVILFEEQDREVQAFAQSMAESLKSCGWTVSVVEALSEESLVRNLPGQSLPIVLGLLHAIESVNPIAVYRRKCDSMTPPNALINAFGKEFFMPVMLDADSLPTNRAVVIIRKRP